MPRTTFSYLGMSTGVDDHDPTFEKFCKKNNVNKRDRIEAGHALIEIIDQEHRRYNKPKNKKVKR